MNDRYKEYCSLMGKFKEYCQMPLECGENVFIAHNATVFGNVKIGNNVSIWYHTTIRGDINRIEIGDGSNIQDGSVLHVGVHEPCIVGKNVTVGHNVNLHGTKVGDNCLIGIGAILLNGSVVEDNAIVAAGSVVPPGKVVKSNSLYMGSPAKFVKELTEENYNHIKANAQEYVDLITLYRELGIK